MASITSAGVTFFCHAQEPDNKRSARSRHRIGMFFFTAAPPWDVDIYIVCNRGHGHDGRDCFEKHSKRLLGDLYIFKRLFLGILTPCKC